MTILFIPMSGGFTALMFIFGIYYTLKYYRLQRKAKKQEKEQFDKDLKAANENMKEHYARWGNRKY